MTITCNSSKSETLWPFLVVSQSERQLTITFMDELLVDYFLKQSVGCLVHKMSDKGETRQSVVPKAQDDVLK